jgi:hypothetical protein
MRIDDTRDDAFLQLDGSALQGEQGLMDIILDPGFATNHFYYVFYARLDAEQLDRVSPLPR